MELTRVLALSAMIVVASYANTCLATSTGNDSLCQGYGTDAANEF